jgi:NAD(P)-dependent dehydrogenase (short-subunit alcohol dehydrogenase family)
VAADRAKRRRFGDVGELEGQVAIITGAGSGIGAATARRFAAEGASVAVFERDPETAIAIAAEVGGHAYALDVRDGDEISEVTDRVAQTFGRIDILVNNAGTGDLRPLHTVDDKLWHRLIDVNLTGTFNATRAVIPYLLELGGGAIVNNASVSGLLPTRNEAAYSAAKAGVISLTKSAALEYGPTVRVNCVAPGHVRTPMTAVWEQMPDAFEPIAETIPLRRIGEADEIAEVILFLASGRSSYVTGQTLVVDGGATLPQAGTDAALARVFERLQNPETNP